MTAALTWGLLGAWMVHDAEELATMAGWLERHHPELAERYPWLNLSQERVNTAIGLMGVVVAAAAADGARTGGRSAFFQAAVAGFGLHGLTHLAQAAVARGYTPGVVTAPLVVLPYSAWAWRRLKRDGLLRPGRPAAGAAWGVAALAGVHALAHLLTGKPTPS
ncbi:HXXEE domain-containing protein [Nonomuraea sp. NPDC050310]|uniref:HXXEE domain-containing protein n=1 Tax=unclassified Nonomuraea TaxID=2593643 RepID=UPI0033C7A8FF